MTHSLQNLFHIADGLCFQKLPDGAVRVVKSTDGSIPRHETNNILFEQIMTRHCLASIMAAMSEGGYVGDRYYRALDFLNA